MANKQPISPEQATTLRRLCVSSTAPNFVTVNGNDYDIFGVERDTILAEFIECCKEALSCQVFENKWKHLKISN